MDLKERLAQLDRLTRKNTAGRPRRRKAPSGRQTEAALVELGLTRTETPAGPVWSRDLCDRLEPPASVPDLSGLFSQDGARRPPLAEILFLDTETTGLAGGTGTLVFQAGASWWEDGAYVTRQFFLPEPGPERAMLECIGELANGFSVVVTFNGASFDLPLLRTRALLNRLDDPCGALLSWDLLVPARRLWGGRLPNCRQQTIEQMVCRCQREGGDLDGSRVPQAWFDFLATGDLGLLPEVLLHNHRDMLGMARIFLRVCEVGEFLPALASGQDHAVGDSCVDRAGLWALGRICERRRDTLGAAACFERAWSCGWGVVVDVRQRRRFRQDAVRNLKRCQMWDLVEKVIRDGVESADFAGAKGPLRAWHREAAILYEHRLKRLEQALYHAVLAEDDHRAARIRKTLSGDN